MRIALSQIIINASIRLVESRKGSIAMTGKILSVAAAGLMVGLLAMPASAATKGHKMSCSDYAWQSQQMKDCMAKQDAMKNKSSKKSMKKMSDTQMPKKQ